MESSLKITPDKKTIYNVIDAGTGEMNTYTLTKKWWDESPMDDTKVDGSIYKKYEDRYYKLNWSGALDVRRLGCNPDYDLNRPDGRYIEFATDNWFILQKFIDSLPAYTYLDYFLPNVGAWYFGKPIVWKDFKGGHIHGVPMLPYGDWRSATCLFFGNNEAGIHVLAAKEDDNGVVRHNALDGCVISNIHIISTHTNPGLDNCGIYHERIIKAENVRVNGFTHGLFAYGNVGGFMNGSNTSLSYYENCMMTNNKRHGFALKGGDANSIMHLNCIGIQNGGFAFYDDSQIGAVYLGGQTATNGTGGIEGGVSTGGGGIAVMQASAFTAGFGIYNEGDQARSYISPTNAYANFIGGIHGSGWTGSGPGEPWQPQGGCTQQGFHANKLYFDQTAAMKQTIGEMEFTASKEITGQVRTGLHIQNFKEPSATFFEAISKNGASALITTKYTNDEPAPFRRLPFASLKLNKYQIINDEFHIRGRVDMEGIAFMPKDWIYNDDWKPGEPEHWRCSKGGRNHNIPDGSIVIKTMGTKGGNQEFMRATLTDREAYKNIIPGDLLEFENGSRGQVWDVNTIYKVKIEKNMDIPKGQTVSYFNHLYNPITPIENEGNFITLTYDPKEPNIKVGDVEWIDDIQTTVAKVWEEKGVKFWSYAWAEGMKAHWFHSGANIVIGKERREIKPLYIAKEDGVTPTKDDDGTERPTVVLGYPTERLEAGATIFMNNLTATVADVVHDVVYIKPLDGNFSGVYKARGVVKVAKPEFVGFGQ